MLLGGKHACLVWNPTNRSSALAVPEFVTLWVVWMRMLVLLASDGAAMAAIQLPPLFKEICQVPTVDQRPLVVLRKEV